MCVCIIYCRKRFIRFNIYIQKKNQENKNRINFFLSLLACQQCKFCSPFKTCDDEKREGETDRWNSSRTVEKMYIVIVYTRIAKADTCKRMM